MVESIATVPYWEVEFDKDGAVVSDGGLVAGLAGSAVRDVFFFSHGWNNSFTGARNLYRAMFTMIAGMLTPEQLQATGFVGVLWPALLFPDDGPPDAGRPSATGAAGSGVAGSGVAGTGLAATRMAGAGPVDIGAAGVEPVVDPTVPPPPATGADLAAALAHAFPGQEENLRVLGDLLDTQPQDGAAVGEFYRRAAGLVTSPQTGGPEDNGERFALEGDPHEIIDAMAGLPGSPGDAQGLDLFDKAWHGARELLRTLSYYEMKNRAGVVGERGLGRLLGTLHGQNGQLRVHLLGHSFGARLAAFSLRGLPAPAAAGVSPVKSLLLIQAAFSHFAFSPAKPGALAAFADRVDGPLVTTHSDHDRAVGTWYPAASALAGQDAQGVGNLPYRWGALGFDGFQQDHVAAGPLQRQGFPYQWTAGGFHRLDASAVISKNLSGFSGAHCDIQHPEVTWAAVSAAGLGG